VSALPAVTVRGAAFGLEWELPTEGRLGQLLTMRLKVVNHTNELRALRLTFSENAAFLFCGLKLFHFRLVRSAGAARDPTKPPEPSPPASTVPCW
jgi:hypothetical protein